MTEEKFKNRYKTNRTESGNNMYIHLCTVASLTVSTKYTFSHVLAIYSRRKYQQGHETSYSTVQLRKCKRYDDKRYKEVQ